MKVYLPFWDGEPAINLRNCYRCLNGQARRWPRRDFRHRVVNWRGGADPPVGRLIRGHSVYMTYDGWKVGRVHLSRDLSLSTEIDVANYTMIQQIQVWRIPQRYHEYIFYKSEHTNRLIQLIRICSSNQNILILIVTNDMILIAGVRNVRMFHVQIPV